MRGEPTRRRSAREAAFVFVAGHVMAPGCGGLRFVESLACESVRQSLFGQRDAAVNPSNGHVDISWLIGVPSVTSD
ncbi:hypothetical protein RKD27_000553 [Streptomyces sp. SAI-126]|nr:hypothetical protein [Streptomyces sp. SAI-119]MDH6494026.1 hypothetical protein [Streptomyces sp. SAI-149]